MIRTEGLSKHFQAGPRWVQAVDDLTLEVREGEVFGFLGPNGAGKTTTVRMLDCLIAPTRGRAWINGLPVGQADREIRGQVGILTESPGLYERLSARYNLQFFATLYGVRNPAAQVERYLRLFGLWDQREQPAGIFSKGMKQKLAIARALLHEPPVLFLDEPTSALDPEAAKTVRDSIEMLKGQGRTIFLCTHNLAEAEQLCDRIAIFRGRLIALDSPTALRERLYGQQTVVQLAQMTPALVEAVQRLPFVEKLDAETTGEGGRLTIRLRDPVAHNPAIVGALVTAGGAVQYVTELKHSLEDVYLNLLHNDAGKAGDTP